MHQIITSCLIGALGVFSGCVEHYTPKVDLSESPATIPITVELHRFKELLKPRCPGNPMDWWHLAQKWLSQES
jgi:hypothetical protein